MSGEGRHPALVASLDSGTCSEHGRRALQEMAADRAVELSRLMAGDGDGKIDAEVMTQLLPSLVPALAELSKAVEHNEAARLEDASIRKIDPVAWLASYLFRHNPRHRPAKTPGPAGIGVYGGMLARALRRAAEEDA